ncbi:Asp-tRNA(Asn)/Glu-tRNA(Gln) amidotransferase subunit GatC [Proteinivorax tanatarense]|uniref:Asp-tRNA(Asn)/Glu-tRNA(Gln) amidotransferase subunit GatC n=1 Tax=Proteinivorax tanatarense TaxID=1260629 RepID=A0AAU7VRQ0_9FIRM
MSKEELKELARISMLEIRPEEMNEYIKELDQVLSYADNLKKLDLEDVQPTERGCGHCTMRHDKVEPNKGENLFKNNITSIEHGFVKVEQVNDRGKKGGAD